MTVRRRAGRARYDRETIDAILDEGMIGHVGVVSDGQPFALPVLYARSDSELYLHGSPLSRLLRAGAAAAPMCLTVTLLDGMVLARSAFHHSLNYRSVVVLGDGRAVRHADEKRAALRVIIEHALPGRSEDVRGPSEQELAATEVVALAIREASAKVRAGPPADAPEDYALPVWAGELPVVLAIGEPVADSRCSAQLPDYVHSLARTHV